MLLDRQLKTDWGKLLGGMADAASPGHVKLFGLASSYPVEPYWSLQQSEWASDVMFKSPRLLGELYPQLIRHGIQSLASVDVLRFLGHRTPSHGGVHGCFQGEVLTNLKQRPEGICIKHHVNANSIKMYDKQQSVLRVETTINDPHDFKAYRASEDDPKGPKSWRPLRKGVADTHRRAQISQKANDRYLQAMASTSQSLPLKKLAQPLCRAVHRKGRRARALNPLSLEDATLLAAVARGEFTINGFRNRDIRGLLYRHTSSDEAEMKRRSAAITRKLRLLRAHHLIRKVTGTHRYLVTAKGREKITALLAATELDVSTLAKAA
jgi:hypothetical protein